MFFFGFQPAPLVAGFGPTPSVAEQVCSAGDFKYSFKSTAHGKWVPTNGALKSSLPATQQTTATSLGIGINLPDTRDRTIIGASGTKSLNSQGGAATVVLSQANLPNINLVGGNHAHSINDPGHSHSLPAVGNGTFNSNGLAGANGGLSYSSAAATTGISINTSGSLSIPLGGLGTAIATQDPYVALNGFVCL